MVELFLILFLSWMFSTTVMVAVLAIMGLSNVDKIPCGRRNL